MSVFLVKGGEVKSGVTALRSLLDKRTDDWSREPDLMSATLRPDGVMVIERIHHNDRAFNRGDLDAGVIPFRWIKEFYGAVDGRVQLLHKVVSNAGEAEPPDPDRMSTS